MSDKANYKQVLDILIKTYKQNGDVAKAAEMEKRKLEVEKLDKIIIMLEGMKKA